MNNLTLRITYLYPHHMNLYGDSGNLICLQKRCQWREIECKIKLINPGDQLKAGETDLYFFGGGQDKQQEFVAQDLQRHQSTIQTDIENGVAALTICGGYQLFGHRFTTQTGEVIPGIGIFDIETFGSDHRMIGNLVVKLSTELQSQLDSSLDTLIGFENHSGETRITSGNPLGQVVKGYGNNYTSKQEGYAYKNAFGSYLHGSLLPKNPHLADLLIAKALKIKNTELPKLDNTLEIQTHNDLLARLT